MGWWAVSYPGLAPGPRLLSVMLPLCYEAGGGGGLHPHTRPAAAQILTCFRDEQTTLRLNSIVINFTKVRTLSGQSDKVNVMGLKRTLILFTAFLIDMGEYYVGKRNETVYTLHFMQAYSASSL